MAGKKKFEGESDAASPERASLLDLERIRELIELLERSDVTRLSWRRGPERLVIQRGAVAHAAPAVVSASAHHPPGTPSASTGAASPGPRVSAPEPPPAASKEKAGSLVTSPFVGTFYRAAGPDQPVFVEMGSVVKKGQVLCIIEAMKLMNEIETEVAGTVTEVLAENGQPVEFGQALFRIEPL
jgi:acetyl-CoA carboxylase biotin carboxyl carrier protein